MILCIKASFFKYKINPALLITLLEALISVCKKTLSALRKRQDQGARSPKERSVHGVLEHFWDERNEDIGVFFGH